MADDLWLRYWGEAMFEGDYGLAEAILDKAPAARGVYTMKGDMKLEVFHLECAHAEIRNMFGVFDELEC